MGKVISLRVQNLRASARKVVGQIETPCSPDPIMRRPCADREEKRVTRGSDMIQTRTNQKQLDLADPNQRRALRTIVRKSLFFFRLSAGIFSNSIRWGDFSYTSPVRTRTLNPSRRLFYYHCAY